MLTLQLSEAEIASLNYERFSYPCPLVQKRLHSVYLKATQKLTNQAVGDICALHPRTVSKWVHKYKKEGKQSLYEVNYGTNQSVLAEHQTTIIASLTAQPPISLKEAKDRIQTLTDIERSLTQVRVFLQKQGFKCRKLGHLPAKADVNQQEQWLENDLKPALELAQQGQIQLLFMDAAHFVLAPVLCWVWSITRIFIQAPAGRQRLNVLATVNALTQQLLFQTNNTTINADTLKDFLGFLKAQLPDLPLVIVLDNARYQHCKAVKELALSLGITLLFLPPYSPNLNIIERLWKLIKKKVLYAKYYEKFEQFQKSIIGCLNRKDAPFQQELKALMTLKFQTFKNDSFYTF